MKSKKTSYKKPKPEKVKSKQYRALTFLIVSHFRALKHSLKGIAAKPVSCLMTAVIIGITLSLPATLYVLLHNFQQITKHWNNKTNRINLFKKYSQRKPNKRSNNSLKNSTQHS